MATKTICDYCGKEIKEPFKDFRGDLAKDALACIEIKPTLLNRDGYNMLHDPDLCRECIITILRN